MLSSSSSSRPERVQKQTGDTHALGSTVKGLPIDVPLRRVNTCSSNSGTGRHIPVKSPRGLDLGKLFGAGARSTTPMTAKKAPVPQSQIMLVPVNLDPWCLRRGQNADDQSNDPLDLGRSQMSMQYNKSAPSLLRPDSKWAQSNDPLDLGRAQMHLKQNKSAPLLIRPNAKGARSNDPLDLRRAQMHSQRTKPAHCMIQPDAKWVVPSPRVVQKRTAATYSPRTKAELDPNVTFGTQFSHGSASGAAPWVYSAACKESSTSADLRESNDREFNDGVQVGMTLKEYFDTADREPENPVSRQFSGWWADVPAYADDVSDAEFDRIANPPTAQAIMDEEKRETIREVIRAAAGGELAIFRAFDSNGNNHISPTEFSDGLKRLRVNWQAVTDLKKPGELYKLFDRDGNHEMTMQELFPDCHLQVEADRQRMSTPDFWEHWCKRTNQRQERPASPKWVPSSPHEKLKVLHRSADRRQEVEADRHRMSATFQRLKKQGMSDAQCRECVAPFLPRGTGPKDSEDTHTFSEAEVRACKRVYNDPILSNVRNIQKNINDMREQRQDLKGSRLQLWATVVEPAMRAVKGRNKAK